MIPALVRRRPARARTARAFTGAFVREEGAAAMVEFAIIALLLFTLLFGFIDFARALYLYNNLTNAARVGARFGATQLGDGGPCVTAEAAIIQETANRIREFNNNPAVNPGQFVTVLCDPPPPAEFPLRVTVRIQNYPFQAITPLPFLQNLTLGSAAVPIDAVVRFEGAPAGG